jgi:hypothetical protein
MPGHRCTVVGNPEGGPWVFLANSFEEGTWGCEKIRGVVFYCILMWIFFKNFNRGVHVYEVPPSPLSNPVCMCQAQQIVFVKLICNSANNL